MSSQPAADPESALLLDVIGRLYAAGEAEQPESALMAEVARLAPCHAAVLNAIRLRPNSIRSWSSNWPRTGPRLNPSSLEVLHEHPTMPRLTQAVEHAPIALSETGSQRALRENPFVADHYLPHGLRHQVTFSVGPAGEIEPGAIWVVGVNRLEGVDFSQRELRLLDACRPHLARVLRFVSERRRFDQLTELRAAAAAEDAAGAFVIGPDGALVDAAPCVLEAWRRWFPNASSQTVPQEIAGLVSEMIQGRRRLAQRSFERSGARLRLKLKADPGAAGLVAGWLREETGPGEGEIQRRLGLTERQAVIARWISEGKTNPEIALLLGLSPRTVEKHVEAILGRLGVENRQAVVRVVLDR